MSPSHSRLPLDRSIREALVAALKLKMPPGQPMTIDVIEEATTLLLRDLGPQIMEDCIQGVEETPKKGGLLSAVAAPRRTKG